MKTEKFSFNVETAYGNKLVKPVPVTGEFEALETYTEIPAKEIPDQNDILKYVNAARKAAARAKSTAEALQTAGIEKPTLKDSEELQISTMAKVFMARGQSEEVARQNAKNALGL